MIEQKDIDRLKEIFVTRQECQTTEDRLNEKMQSISQDVTTVKTKLNAVIGILGAIAIPILSIAVNLLFK